METGNLSDAYIIIVHFCLQQVQSNVTPCSKPGLQQQAMIILDDTEAEQVSKLRQKKLESINKL
jgi:hypothetical protein